MTCLNILASRNEAIFIDREQIMTNEKEEEKKKKKRNILLTTTLKQVGQLRSGY